MTNYMVLKQTLGEGSRVAEAASVSTWIQVGPPVESVSAEAAIRKAVDGDQGGTFVAVPVRSWHPVSVTVETKRTLSIA